MAKTINKFFTFLLISACLLSRISTTVVGSTGDCGSSCCQNNAIYVNGQGKISVQPDIAYITVGVSVTDKTSQAAQQGVANKVAQINKILNNNNINRSDVDTQAISIYPQYEYPNGKMTLVGQNAQQSLTVTVRKVDKNGGDLGTLIDQLVAVDGVQVSNLRFDKDDKSVAQKQARKLAFNDAKKKASQFADLADRTLGKALSIVDESTSSPSPVYSGNSFAKMSVANAPTDVPVGEMDVIYNVNVKFGMK